MLKRMPFVLLLVAAVLLFIAGLFTSNKEWIDIHLHDTVFVIPQGHILGLAAFFLFLLWLINIATYSILFSNKLTWFHIVTTLGIILFVVWYTFTLTDGQSGSLSRRYIPGPEQPVSEFRDVNAVVMYSIAALTLVQMVFIANLLIGLYRKTTSTESLPL
ncbi:hypothetical protein LL912_16605 [Niabella sp. CC-SYL272]|uniref:hypothetical protein n=1 Tax=Niabella agricola TaxID=2891571 RepID=UPI001F1CA8EE|nr:hypothetical protein [Niabella agricola]MCF3110408.1 hypothetical protein [Niabella agricola]